MNSFNNGIDEKALAALFEWMRRLTPRVQSTLTAMLEHPLRLSLEEPRRISIGDIAAAFPDGPVGLSARFGLQFGGWHILLSRPLSATVADMAAMGDGTAKFDEINSPEALRAVWTQILTAVEPELTAKIGDTFTVASTSVTLEPEEILQLAGGQPAFFWRLQIEGLPEARIMMFVEPQFLALFSETATPEIELMTPKQPVIEDKPPAAKSVPDSSKDVVDVRSPSPVVKPAEFADFGSRSARGEGVASTRDISSLLDISLPIAIELGRTKMLIRDVLDLGPGSVIELDKLSGEPVDLFVNDKKFARGEVVVIEENFGVRITELLKVDERIRALK